jgi:hypothetical protein
VRLDLELLEDFPIVFGKLVHVLTIP